MESTVVPHSLMPDHAGTSTAFSTDNLTEADRQAVCSHLSDTLGWQVTDLRAAMQATGMTPVALWSSLRDTSSLRLMIAAAALRCVTRLPDDPRLRPAPHSPAPVARPRTDAERARASRATATGPSTGRTLSPDARIVSVAPNPKRPGSASWDRYQKWRVGATLAEMRAEGMSAADVGWDGSRGFVVWAEPGEIAAESQTSEGD